MFHFRPSHNFTNWVRGGKEKRWVGWLSCSFHCSIAFFGSGDGDGAGGRQERGEGGCIDQPEEWRGRKGRKAGKGSRPDQYTTAAWGQGGGCVTSTQILTLGTLSNLRDQACGHCLHRKLSIEIKAIAYLSYG